MSELLKKTALELADLLAAGEITSVELTQACLDRIQALNPKLNAFLFVDDDGARSVSRLPSVLSFQFPQVFSFQPADIPGSRGSVRVVASSKGLRQEKYLTERHKLY